MGRGPHREPHLDRVRPRLPHARRAGGQGREDDRPAGDAPLRPGGLLRRRAAVEVPGRPVPHRHRLVRHPGRARRRGRLVHEQGARRRRVPLLVPRHRGLVPDRAARRQRGARARRRRRRSSGSTTSSSRSSSRTSPRPGSSTTPATTPRRCGSRSRSSATTSCAASRRRPGRRAACSASASRRSPRSSAPATARSTTSPACGCSTRPSSACTRPARRSSSSASSRRARATRRRSRRSSPRSSGSRTEDVEVQEGDTDNTPYGLGTYASRSTPVAGRRDDRHRPQAARQGRGRSPRTCSRRRADDIEFEAGRFFVKGSPERAKTIQDVAFAAYTEPPRRHGGGARGRHLLRPAEHDVPVRHVRGRGRGRPRHRPVEARSRSSRSTTAASGSTR